MKTAIILLTLILALASYAEVINVPDDHETIQGAIDASEDGDTVLVAPGEFIENIDFDGKAIAVIGNPDDPSETVIDGDANGSSVVVFRNEEGENSVLRGFTIWNGLTDWGGGIYCNETNPSLSNLIVQENRATRSGGGIYCTNSIDMIIRNCSILSNVAEDEEEDHNVGGGIVITASNALLEQVIIANNLAENYGGGLWVGGYTSNVTIINCQILRNSSVRGGGIYKSSSTLNLNGVVIADNEGDYGGGIFNHNSGHLNLSNVTMTNNVATTDFPAPGGGIHSHGNSHITLIGSILWDNEPEEVGFNLPNRITLSYSDFAGGDDGIVFAHQLHNRNRRYIVFWEDGCIDEDPQFADPDEGDYHLTADSPCIDAGDLDAELDPDGTRADMGAFYFHQRDIEIDVEELVFEPVEAGEIDSLPLVVRNVGNNPLTINYSMSLNNPRFRVHNENEDIEIEALSDYTIWVTFMPDSALSYAASLLIESDDPDEGEIEIAIEGEAFTDIEQDDALHPLEFAITGTYPNPFNSTATIEFTLPVSQAVTVGIYAPSGQKIDSFDLQSSSSGYNSLSWNGSEISSGIYIVRLRSADEVRTAKLLCIK